MTRKGLSDLLKLWIGSYVLLIGGPAFLDFVNGENRVGWIWYVGGLLFTGLWISWIVSRFYDEEEGPLYERLRQLESEIAWLREAMQEVLVVAETASRRHPAQFVEDAAKAVKIAKEALAGTKWERREKAIQSDYGCGRLQSLYMAQANLLRQGFENILARLGSADPETALADTVLVAEDVLARIDWVSGYAPRSGDQRQTDR